MSVNASVNESVPSPGSSVIAAIVSWALSLNPVVASFVISLVFNAIPYMTVPYLVLIAGYGASGNFSMMDKLLVAVSGGVGAAVGKLVVFYIGRVGHHILSEETRENLEVFARAFRRGVFAAVLLFAALPLPDDVLYIPLGVAGYSPVLFFTAVALGKTFITGLAVFFGDLVKSLVAESSVDPVVTVAALLVGSLIVAVIISRMNWRRIVEVYNEYGIIAATFEMIVQGLIALMPRNVRSRVEKKIDGLLPKLSLKR